MKLYKQSVADALWALLGGVIGGVAVGAVTVHRYLNTPVDSTPKGVSDEQHRAA